MTGFAAALRAGAADVWDAQHAHPFVRALGAGDVPSAAFRFYVRQDFRFLTDYGRLLSLASARAPRVEWQERFAILAAETLSTEMALHRDLADRWAVPLDAAPAPATAAYCDFLLRTAALGDYGELVAATLPCMWAYAELASRLPVPSEPDCAAWVTTYASAEFGALAGWARDITDAVAEETGAAGRERMHAAFHGSSTHELAFWDAAWSARAQA